MNYSINNTKMLCALVVVAIHCNLFIDVNELLRTEFVNIIIRIPVPFFICVTGYYLTKRLYQDKNYIDKLLRKLFYLYSFWTMFYFIFIKIPGFLRNETSINRIIMETLYAVFQAGMVGPLWYFPALILGLFAFKILYKEKSLIYLWAVAIPCYIMLILSQTYYAKYTIIDGSSKIFRVFYGNYDSLICGAFGCALLYLTIGSYIARQQKKTNTNQLIICGIVVVLLYHLEMIISLLSGYWIGERGSYFMLPIVIYILMKLLVYFPDKIRCDFFEKNQYSAGIYFIHGFYLYIVKYIFSYTHTSLNSIIYTLLVISLSWISIKLLKIHKGYIGRLFQPYI